MTTSGASGGRTRPRVRGVSVFFGVLAVVFAAYTMLAFQLEWETAAGRIGAGFFPRIVGSAAFVLCAGVALWTLRPRRDDRDDGDPGPVHVRATVLMVGAGVLFVVLLVPLGTVIATSLFTFAALTLLDRSRPVRAAVISVSMSVLLYLLLQVGLNAGLPKGLLSMF